MAQWTSFTGEKCGVFRMGQTEKDPVGRRRRSKVLCGGPAPREWAGADMGVSGALNLSDSLSRFLC